MTPQGKIPSQLHSKERLNTRVLETQGIEGNKIEGPPRPPTQKIPQCPTTVSMRGLSTYTLFAADVDLVPGCPSFCPCSL